MQQRKVQLYYREFIVPILIPQTFWRVLCFHRNSSSFLQTKPSTSKIALQKHRRPLHLTRHRHIRQIQAKLRLLSWMLPLTDRTTLLLLATPTLPTHETREVSDDTKDSVRIGPLSGNTTTVDRNFVSSDAIVKSNNETTKKDTRPLTWDDQPTFGKRTQNDEGHKTHPLHSSKAELTAKPHHASKPACDTKMPSDPLKTNSLNREIGLPAQLAGGWGEEPEPAPWDWSAMPIDHLGILEEQRRTVFYESRETGTGTGEWILPNQGGQFDVSSDRRLSSCGPRQVPRKPRPEKLSDPKWLE